MVVVVNNCGKTGGPIGLVLERIRREYHRVRACAETFEILNLGVIQ